MMAESSAIDSILSSLSAKSRPLEMSSIPALIGFLLLFLPVLSTLSGGLITIYLTGPSVSMVCTHVSGRCLRRSSIPRLIYNGLAQFGLLVGS